MTALTLTRKNLLPWWAKDVLDTGMEFNPSLLNFDDGFAEFDMAVRMPNVNIVENQKDFKIELAAPGLEKKDFHIDIENNILSIRCEKKEEVKEKKENYTRREFTYNKFERSFRLPENTLPEKIDAKYENGILSLTLPKKDVPVAKNVKEIKIS